MNTNSAYYANKRSPEAEKMGGSDGQPPQHMHAQRQPPHMPQQQQQQQQQQVQPGYIYPSQVILGQGPGNQQNVPMGYSQPPPPQGAPGPVQMYDQYNSPGAYFVQQPQVVQPYPPQQGYPPQATQYVIQEGNAGGMQRQGNPVYSSAPRPPSNTYVYQQMQQPQQPPPQQPQQPQQRSPTQAMSGQYLVSSVGPPQAVPGERPAKFQRVETADQRLILQTRKNMFVLILHMLQDQQHVKWSFGQKQAMKGLSISIEGYLYNNAFTYEEYANVLTLKERILKVAGEIAKYKRRHKK